jgi:agmatinase
MHTQPPRFESLTFMNLPLCTDLSRLEAHFAILGIPYGMPYSMDEMGNDQSNAPAAIRRGSARLSLGLDRWDFDLGGLLLAGGELSGVDCGDVPGDPFDPLVHYQLAENAIREILACQAMPIVLGGDHGVSIPVLRALDAHGPVTLIQVDAHIDWRDEVNGVPDGYSSPIRRAAEMAHIGGIFQIGMRAQGSARAQDMRAALAYGAKIITAYEVHEQGMESVLAQIPAGGRYYLTIDADGLDPSVMPAVAGPAAGGLLFHQVRCLMHGLAAKGRLLGMDIVEITPSRDLNGISAITAGQLILNFMGVALRSGKKAGT